MTQIKISVDNIVKYWQNEIVTIVITLLNIKTKLLLNKCKHEVLANITESITLYELNPYP